LNVKPKKGKVSIVSVDSIPNTTPNSLESISTLINYFYEASLKPAYPKYSAERHRNLSIWMYFYFNNKQLI